MIGFCGWIVCLWDLDRLFFKLESQIDSQVAALESKSGESGDDGTLLGQARELLLNKVLMGGRVASVKAIEKTYWTDINACGALAFPKPDITAAVDQIEKSRRDLLAPLTEIIRCASTAACCCDSCRSSVLSLSSPQFAFISAYLPGRA